MGTSNYSDKFKRDAVQQIRVRGYSVREVSQRLGVSSHSLYKWLRLFAEPAPKLSGIDHEAENRRLKRELARVTDITDIKSHEGWLYLAVVIDPFSRRVDGWSAQPRMTTKLAQQALLAAAWRRKPRTRVMIHCDQGSQFTSREWQPFLGHHNLEASMSRRGNCYDRAMGVIGSSPMARAVAESFFHLLKRERNRRRTYLTREAATQDVFDYIEIFYNPKRKHTNNGMLSPVDFENRQQKLNEAGVQETRGASLGRGWATLQQQYKCPGTPPSRATYSAYKT